MVWNCSIKDEAWQYKVWTKTCYNENNHKHIAPRIAPGKAELNLHAVECFLTADLLFISSFFSIGITDMDKNRKSALEDAQAKSRQSKTELVESEEQQESEQSMQTQTKSDLPETGSQSQIGYPEDAPQLNIPEPPGPPISPNQQSVPEVSPKPPAPASRDRELGPRVEGGRDFPEPCLSLLSNYSDLVDRINQLENDITEATRNLVTIQSNITEIRHLSILLKDCVKKCEEIMALEEGEDRTPPTRVPRDERPEHDTVPGQPTRQRFPERFNIFWEYAKQRFSGEEWERKSPKEKLDEKLKNLVDAMLGTSFGKETSPTREQSGDEPGNELFQPGEAISEINKQLGEPTSAKKEPVQPGRKIFGIESPFPKGSAIEAVACIGISMVFCVIILVGTIYGGYNIFKAIRETSEPPPVVIQVTDTISPPVTVTNTPAEVVPSQDEDTPTPPPEEIMADAERDTLLQECNDNFEVGKELLVAHDETGEGDCEAGIELLQTAIESASTVLEVDQDNPEACLCRGLSRLYLEEDLQEAALDFECAVDGLNGDKKAAAERGLDDVQKILSMPICVSMGPVVFAEDWNEDQPVNPNTTFPAKITKEVWAQWSLSNPCGEVAIVKWYHDGRHSCQHHTDELEDWWEWYGSGIVADEYEEGVEPGESCVKVFIGSKFMTEGCFTIE